MRSLLCFIMPKIAYAAYGASANFSLLFGWLCLSIGDSTHGGVPAAMLGRRDDLSDESRIEKVATVRKERA